MTEEMVLAEARRIIKEIGDDIISENLDNEDFFIIRTLTNGSTITLLFEEGGFRAIFEERYSFSQTDPNQIVINFKWRKQNG